MNPDRTPSSADPRDAGHPEGKGSDRAEATVADRDGSSTAIGGAGGNNSEQQAAGGPTDEPAVVVFLIDTSGSMVETLPIAIRRLRKRIAEMSVGQRVAIVAFNHRGVTEPPMGNPVKITEATRRELMSWLGEQDWKFGKWSDPRAAIDAALKFDPQRIHIFSDDRFGRAPGGQAGDVIDGVLQRLEQSDAEVHAVQLLYRGETSYLRRLAERTHGAYRFVAPDGTKETQSLGERPFR
jgi:hypothetical protein